MHALLPGVACTLHPCPVCMTAVNPLVQGRVSLLHSLTKQAMALTFHVVESATSASLCVFLVHRPLTIKTRKGYYDNSDVSRGARSAVQRSQCIVNCGLTCFNERQGRVLVL